MKQEFNLDIHPKEDTRALYPSLSPIFQNNRLCEAFDEQEAKATHFKKRYWFLTRFAITFISISVFSAISFWLFAEEFPDWPLRTIAGYMGVFGIVGGALEFYLIFAKTKEKWLLNRFLAERLRSYIAQLYAAGAAAKSAPGLIETIDLYTTRAMAALDSDAQMGKASFRRFRPEQGVLAFDVVDNPSAKILNQCEDAYQDLRVEFQKKFVKGELEKLSDLGRVESSITDIAFVFGVLFTIFGLLALPFALDDLVSKCMVLIGVSLFFMSAILGLTGTGSVSQGNYRRYQNYLDQLDGLPPPTADSPAEFLDRIAKTEIEALRELEAFCAQVDSASFRI